MLLPAQPPFLPAVQLVREVDLFVPPTAAARAVPLVRVLQPVPMHWAVTCARSLPANPLVPAMVPLSHAAATCAVVAPKRLSAFTPGADAEVDEAAVICAWHLVLPSHPVAPVAVLMLRWPFGPATALTLPVSLAVQPASGQSTCELAC